MGILCYVLGRTGTGKSYSMRNFPQDDLAVINVVGKVLPFRDSAKIEQIATDNSDDILKAIKAYAVSYKSIVVDDFQYVMSNEFMRRAMERGYDKFTEIAAHAWAIADVVRTLPSDVIVYVMCHTDTDQEGTERLKTIGKLLDEKIYLEGMSTIVLKTVVSDGNYGFQTQNNGRDTVKSPAGMFPSFTIKNDLYYVDQKIREYYGLGATMSAEELANADADAAEDIDDRPKKRTRKTEESKEEPKRKVREPKPEPEPADEPTDTEPVDEQSEVAETTEATEATETPSEPRRRRRRRV